jgi:hypothetical protein
MSLKDKLAAIVPGQGSGASTSEASRLARYFKPLTNEQHEKRDAVLLGIALGTFALGSLSLYLPLTGCLGLLLAFAGCRYLSRRFGFHVATVTVVTYIVSLYVTLIQPLIGMFIGPVLISGFLAWLYHRRFAGKKLASRRWTRRLSTLVVIIAGAVPSFFVYNWVYTAGIPAVHLFTVPLWNFSPFIYVASAMLLTLYCVQRGQASKSLVYRLAPGLTVVGFALLYPMHEAVPGGFLQQITAGDIVEWSFAVAIFALSFIRPSWMRLGGLAVGSAFCLMFAVFQMSNWAYMSAIGISMPVRYATTAPQTVNERTMPLLVGQSSCPQGDTTPKTATGPVSIALNGSHFDFQCALHYTSWIGTDPLLSLISGSTLDVIRVDAGSKSGEVREIHGRFYFGEDSAYFRAAVMARHPGAIMGDYNYTEGTGGGNLELAVSYSQKRLFWGAMIPAVGGSVEESQSGGFEDYTVAEAASKFPDFFQVPEGVVKLRAQAWAGYRNPMASAWSPDEISETDSGPSGQSQGGNHPPFGMALTTGPAWFVGLEPQGTNATAMSYFMFFDARYGTATILDVSQASPKLKGLQDIQHLAPSVVTGNNGLYGIEPIPLITADGRCFYSVSVMGPHVEMRNRDFQGVAVFTCSGDKVSNTVLDTSAKVDAAIASWPAVKIGQTAAPVATNTPSLAPPSPPVPVPASVPDSAHDAAPTPGQPANRPQ